MDSNNANVEAALASIGPGRISPAEDIYEQAKALQAERKWLRAGEMLSEAVKKYPNDIMCRVEAHRSNQQLNHARKLRAEGVHLANERRLDKAIAVFVQAKEVWPFIENIEEGLANARAKREQAETYYEEASVLAEKSEWPAVIEKAQECLTIFPYHKGAIEVTARANHEMAKERYHEGQSLKGQGQTLKAERSFYEALGHVPDMNQAQQGIAKIAFERGSEAEQAELWGKALIWYTEAISHHGRGEYKKRLETVRGKIVQRIGYNLSLEVASGGGNMAGGSGALKSTILHLMSTRRPSYLATAARGEYRGQEDYRALVVVNNLDVRTNVIRSENKVHDYTIYRDVPNPEIPKILGELESADRKLSRMQRQVHQPCYGCRGSGKVKCSACGGSGKQKCKACKGTGKSGEEDCSACSGTGKTTCGRCHGSGQVNCDKCRGSGKHPDVDQKDVRRQERKVRDLERELSRTPATVSKGFPAQWPYTVDLYEKQGIIEVSIEIAEARSGAVFNRDATGKSQVHRDTTIQNPNPSIGLEPNDLHLPGDSEVRMNVTNQVALQVSSRILKAVANKRIAETGAEIKRLRLAQANEAAVEAEADLACLLEARDRKGAAEIIDRLREELKKSLVDSSGDRAGR